MNYELTSDWELTDLGVQEDWVYDIEVEGAHNFFANDILVHNSIFVNLEVLHQRVIGDKAVDVQKVVNVFDTFAQKEVEPKLMEWFTELAAKLNAYENKLHMKREKIIDRGIWRGKKNYVLQVWDNEGIRYQDSKLVPVGVELAKSTTPEFVKEALRKSLRIILNGSEDEVQHFVRAFKKDFLDRSLYDLATPRGVTDIDKWVNSDGTWKLKTPFHVKAAIVYNRLLHETGLNKKYEAIKNGTKIKYIYLKEPNPTFNNAIAFVDIFHPEFGLDSYVDKKTQYEKIFLSPLESLTSILGWQVEKTIKMDQFFSDDDDHVSVTEWKPPPTLSEKGAELKQRVSRSIASDTLCSAPKKTRKSTHTLTGFF